MTFLYSPPNLGVRALCRSFDTLVIRNAIENIKSGHSNTGCLPRRSNCFSSMRWIELQWPCTRAEVEANRLHSHLAALV